MGDKIIVTDEEEAPKPPDIVVVKQEPKVEKVVTEKTVVKETRKDED
jgi:hypothetical protein